MFESFYWKGILPIISVPFLRDGQIDYGGFIRTLEYIDRTDAFGMVLFGIASEFYKLSDNEKESLIRIYSAFPTEKKKIASITDHTSFLAGEKANWYQELGLDGLMLLPPFFLNPSKKDILDHIYMVLSRVQIPVILQIASKETGVNYSADELFALYRKFPHLIFKIEGSPLPAEDIKKLFDLSREISVFNGYAGKHMIEALELGCHGIMPGCSFIEMYSQIYRRFFEKRQVAEAIHQKVQNFLDKWMRSCEYIIAVEKHILFKKKIITSDYCRMPSYKLTSKDFAEIEDFERECLNF